MSSTPATTMHPIALLAQMADALEIPLFELEGVTDDTELRGLVIPDGLAPHGISTVFEHLSRLGGCSVKTAAASEFWFTNHENHFEDILSIVATMDHGWTTAPVYTFQFVYYDTDEKEEDEEDLVMVEVIMTMTPQTRQAILEYARGKGTDLTKLLPELGTAPLFERQV